MLVLRLRRSYSGNILYFPKNFESWVLLNLTTQKVLRIRAWFHIFLIHYHYSIWWHVRILVSTALLGADLRVPRLVSRGLPRFGLIDHPWCSWRLEAPLLLIMNWILRHLCLRSLEIGRYHMLKAEHILVHVRLRDHVGEILWGLGMVRVHDGQIPHLFIWTTLKTFDSTLKRLASFLYPCFAIWFHQWWQSLMLVTHHKFGWLEGLQVLGLDIRLSFWALGKLDFAGGDFEDGCLFYWWHNTSLFVVLHSNCR